MCGVLGDHPPDNADLAAVESVARSLATPDVDALREGPRAAHADRQLSVRGDPAPPLLSPPALSGWRLLIVGDAVCSFNPAYGQGMSVALCEAKVLDECLAEGDEKLAARVWSRVDALTEAPWAITTGEDFRYPAVVGKRPPGLGVINRYMKRAHHAATRDPVVLRRFFDVANLLAPPTAMLPPAIAWRVLLGGRGRPRRVRRKSSALWLRRHTVEARLPLRAAGIRRIGAQSLRAGPPRDGEPRLTKRDERVEIRANRFPFNAAPPSVFFIRWVPPWQR